MSRRNIQAENLDTQDVQELFCRSLHHGTAEYKTRLQNDGTEGSGLGVSGRAGKPVTPPIVFSSVFFLPGDPAGPYQYARWGNPTWSALEEKLSILEDAECVIFPSGMAAVAAVLCSQLKPGDFDWDHIFGKLGARWLHTGGIFAALSDTTPQLVIEAVQKAKQHGTIVSYDLNYRPSLWKSIGGQKRAQEVNKEIAKYVDVMIGNEEDFTACLGFKVEGADENLLHIDVTAFKRMIETAVKDRKSVV